jgi:hypothetical protein
VIEADLAREWTAFGGASLALMGAALAFGARGYARDHHAWERERSRAVGAPEPDAAASTPRARRYRAAGFIVGLAGLAFAAAAAAGRGLTTRTGPADARIGGACLALLGAVFAVSKALRGRGRGPRFLPGAADGRPFDERAADAAVWSLCALWTVFGLRLALAVPR